MAVFLPDDLIMEILSWLPPKDLIRLQLLSKRWISTICDPKFIQLHRSHYVSFGHTNPNTADRIVVAKFVPEGFHLDLFSESINSNTVVHNSMELIDNRARVAGGEWKFSGSCNGVFCCYNKFHLAGSPLMVCNPSIGWVIHPPTSPFPYPEQEQEQEQEHNNNVVVVYGIGFDPIEGDYKILMVRKRQSRSSSDQFSAVYSLKSKLWKKVSTQVPQGTVVLGRSIFLHGSIHWLIYPPQRKRRNKIKMSILLYDVRNEVFTEMPLPELFLNRGCKKRSICVVRGSLRVMIWDKKDLRFTRCEMWMMKEYDMNGSSSWTMQYNQVLPFEYQHFLGVTIGGKILCSYVVEVADNAQELNRSYHYYRMVILFNPQTKEVTHVCQLQQARKTNMVFTVEGTIDCLNF